MMACFRMDVALASLANHGDDTPSARPLQFTQLILLKIAGRKKNIKIRNRNATKRKGHNGATLIIY